MGKGISVGVGVGVGVEGGPGSTTGVAVGNGVGVGNNVGVGLSAGRIVGVGMTDGDASSPDRVATRTRTRITTNPTTQERAVGPRRAGLRRALEDPDLSIDPVYAVCGGAAGPNTFPGALSKS